MGATQIAQLDTMLGYAEHAVVAGERRCVAPADVPLADEGFEGIQRPALTDAVVGESVHELQQLDGELDVPDAPRPELQLVRRLGGGDELRDALAHPLHVVDEVLPGGARPDLGLDGGDVCLSEHAIAGERARLQECLELPALGPSVVVRQVGIEAPDECTLLALGAQIGIDLPERRLDLHAGDAAHRLHSEARRDVDRTALPHLLDEFFGCPADEDHVHIADVVQFAGAGLAHPDDGELRRGDLIAREEAGATAPGDASARNSEGCLERRTRGIRQRGGDGGQHLDGVVGAEIICRDPRQQTSVAHAQCDPRGFVAARSEPLGIRTHGVEKLFDELALGRESFAGFGDVGELSGVAEVEVGEARRRAEEQPEDASHAWEGVGHSCRIAAHDPRETRQRGVGVRRAIRAVQDRRARDRQRIGQLAQQRVGLADVTEAVPREHGPDGCAFAGRHRGLRASRGCSSARTA